MANVITLLERAAAGHETPGLTQKKLRPEIRNDGNEVTAGFSFADCELVTALDFSGPVIWKGGMLSDVATRDIRVVFQLTGAESFFFDINRQTTN